MWLDDGEEIDFVDLENAVHPLERHDHPAVSRHRSTCVARSRTADDERNAVLRAKASDLRDLCCRPWKKYQVREVTLTERIRGVSRPRRVIIADVLTADSLGDQLTKGCGHDQCDAPAPDGCSDSTKRSMRVAPSRNRSSDVA